MSNSTSYLEDVKGYFIDATMQCVKTFFLLLALGCSLLLGAFNHEPVLKGVSMAAAPLYKMIVGVDMVPLTSLQEPPPIFKVVAYDPDDFRKGDAYPLRL